MTRILALIILSVYLGGCCSMPSVESYNELQSFNREERETDMGMGGKRKTVLLNDFRKNEIYDEDVTALKEKVERYISNHPALNESTKNNLRQLKVAEGFTKEEVELLLAKPDKLVSLKGGVKGSASEIWIYRINKLRAFTVFIIPIFLAHEGYYLYFKDDALVRIERHYLRRIVEQNDGAGVGQDIGIFKK